MEGSKTLQTPFKHPSFSIFPFLLPLQHSNTNGVLFTPDREKEITTWI